MEPASPMSWGAWILAVVYPVLVAGVLLDPPRALRERLPPRLGRLADDPFVRRRVGQVSVGVGLALGVYTGILLSALGARPLWSSALLGPLFLISGLSTSAALAHWWAPDRAESERLARLDSALIGAELAVLALFLIGLSASTAAHAEAAALLLGGPYTAVFWVGVVGLGLALPLALQMLAAAGRIAHTPVAPLLVLAGGLALRFVIVVAGQASHWSPS
jgi:protein NrfD